MARRVALLRTSLLGTLTCLSKAAPSPQCSATALSSHGSPSLLLKPSASRPTSIHAPLPLPSLPRQAFSSSSSAGSIVVINSSEELNSSLSKAQDDKLPTIFYFTATWCGPCRYISPVIEELSKKYPHVTTYKIDIDLDGLGSTLNKLQISAVPTLHFFHNGKKMNEMVGADINRLKETMENLYKLD